MRSRLALFLVAIAAIGCQTSDDAPIPGATATTISAATASAIAGDIASRFAEQVPAASTTLEMKPDHSDFAVALQAALKGLGYSLAADTASKEEKAVKLAYLLQASGEQLFASLMTPSITISRTYAGSSGGATPASPLMVLRTK